MIINVHMEHVTPIMDLWHFQFFNYTVVIKVSVFVSKFLPFDIEHLKHNRCHSTEINY